MTNIIPRKTLSGLSLYERINRTPGVPKWVIFDHRNRQIEEFKRKPFALRWMQSNHIPHALGIYLP